MKKIFAFALTLLLLSSCVDSNRRYIRFAINKMDKQGLFAEGPAWDSVKTAALAAKPDSLAEAQEIVSAALKIAGGKHSFLLPADQAQDYATRDWETASLRMLDSIAVIKLPPFAGNQNEAEEYIHAVPDSLPDYVRGAIIDLRGNTGGNMYPMIAAVHRFIQDDDILRFRGRDHSYPVTLDIVCRSYAVKQGARIDCPVAILTDSLTASSGEAVLICFRGMERARSFGAPTAGYASGNVTITMPDKSLMALTSSCDVARTGEAFCDDPIAPDVLTETPFEDALTWLGQTD